MTTHRVHVIECSLFLLILFATMAFAPLGAYAQSLGFKGIAAAIAAHNVALTALAVYFVWRSGEGVRAIGWTRGLGWRELWVAVTLFVPFILGVGLLGSVLRAAGFAEPSGAPSFLIPRTTVDYFLAPLLLVVVAIAEETIFRGYLLLRLEQATGRRSVAIITSAVLFAFGHAYQGLLAVMVIGVIGVVFALIYYWRGSLVVPMVMHFIQNCVGLLVAPKLLS